MIWLLIPLAIAVLGILAFVAVDADYAFDGDPNTHTLSERIKAWRRGHKGRTLLLAFAIAGIVYLPLYLILHLVLEIV